MHLILNNLVGRPWHELPCWELVVEVYRRSGIRLQGYATYWNEIHSTKSPWEWVAEPTIGAIIVMALYGETADHIAVYTGEGKMIHSTEYAGVCIVPVDSLRKRILGMYRHKEAHDD